MAQQVSATSAAALVDGTVRDERLCAHDVGVRAGILLAVPTGTWTSFCLPTPPPPVINYTHIHG